MRRGSDDGRGAPPVPNDDGRQACPLRVFDDGGGGSRSLRAIEEVVPVAFTAMKRLPATTRRLSSSTDAMCSGSVP
jgi:hypothetical protein